MTGISVRELAEIIGGEVDGPCDVLITGVASISEARPGDVVLAENNKYFSAAACCNASAIIAAEGSCDCKPVIRVDDPRNAFIEVLKIFAPAVSRPKEGIDPSCHVGERVKLGEGASVGYGSYIGDDVVIGDGAVIHPLVYIGDGVKIGAGSVVYPNVTIYQGCEVGSNVTIHAGSVIGSDGFGYIQAGCEPKKVPQIGNVVIEDDVEIGSCTTIDRAKTGSTRIGRGVKIDNLVQIAHNVKVGECSVIAAQVGVSGSAEIGKGVTIAGQAGINGHTKVGDNVVLAGRAAVIGDLITAGIYSGYPARPHREALRAQAMQFRLPELQKTVEELKKEVERLTRQIVQLGGEKIESQAE